VFQHCAQDSRLKNNTVPTHKGVVDLVDSTAAPSKKRKIGANKAKANKDDETQVHEQLFAWTDVLHSLQIHAEKATAAHKHSRRVEVNYSISVYLLIPDSSFQMTKFDIVNSNHHHKEQQ